MKCGILINLVKVYDLFVIVLFVMFDGKVLYREFCIEKNVWDVFLLEEIMKKWKKW